MTEPTEARFDLSVLDQSHEAPALLLCDQRTVGHLIGNARWTGYPARFVIVRGKRCSDRDALLHEWAAALQFPWCFGWNCDAFNDCLGDVSLIPPECVIIVMTDIDLILPDDPRGAETLFGRT